MKIITGTLKALGWTLLGILCLPAAAVIVPLMIVAFIIVSIVAILFGGVVV